MSKHGGLVGPTWVVFPEIGGMWVWVLKCGFLEPTWVWWVFDVGFSNPRGFGGIFVGFLWVWWVFCRLPDFQDIEPLTLKSDAREVNNQVDFPIMKNYSYVT